MNIDSYDDVDVTDTSLYLDTGIAGFEIAYGTLNKTAIRRSIIYKRQIRDKLDSLCEKRHLDKQLNSLSDYWEL